MIKTDLTLQRFIYVSPNFDACINEVIAHVRVQTLVQISGVHTRIILQLLSNAVAMKGIKTNVSKQVAFITATISTRLNVVVCSVAYDEYKIYDFCQVRFFL